MDQRSFELVHGGSYKLTRPETENIISSVNRALHRGGISGVRVDRLRCSDACRILGVTTPTSTLQDTLEHRDTVLRAARTIDSSISDVVPQQKWKWITIHNVPLDHCMGRVGRGDLLKRREELEVEKSGVHIPAEVRWLGGARVRARFQREKSGSSSVVAAVLGEAESGFLGRHEVDAYEEARPDAFCSQYSSPRVLHLCEGLHHDRPPVPRRGVPRGEGLPVPTRDGKACQLRGASRGTG